MTLKRIYTRYHAIDAATRLRIGGYATHAERLTAFNRRRKALSIMAWLDALAKHNAKQGERL